MNDITRMARAAGFWKEHTNTWMCTGEDIARFAALVRADEREACAEVCDELRGYPGAEPDVCAAAIRSRT